MMNAGLLELATGVVSGLSYSQRAALVDNVSLDGRARAGLDATSVHGATVKALRNRGVLYPQAPKWSLRPLLLSPLGRTVWEIVLVQEVATWRERELESSLAWRVERDARVKAEAAHRAAQETIREMGA